MKVSRIKRLAGRPYPQVEVITPESQPLATLHLLFFGEVSFFKKAHKTTTFTKSHLLLL